MSNHTITLLLISVFSANAQSQTIVADEPPPTMRRQIAGKWTVISVVKSGKKTSFPNAEFQEITYTFTKTTFVARVQIAGQEQAEEVTGTYVLDTTVNPTALDVHLGKDKAKKKVAIVQIKDAKLVICGDTSSARQKRPEKFEAHESSGFELIVLRRIGDGR